MHYNRGRPHSSLGPGLPEPMSDQVPPNEHRHRLPLGYRIAKRSVLGGLHHEYGLVKNLLSDGSHFCGLQSASEVAKSKNPVARIGSHRIGASAP
jgi:hypothetical protein